MRDPLASLPPWCCMRGAGCPRPVPHRVVRGGYRGPVFPQRPIPGHGGHARGGRDSNPHLCPVPDSAHARWDHHPGLPRHEGRGARGVTPPFEAQPGVEPGTAHLSTSYAVASCAPSRTADAQRRRPALDGWVLPAQLLGRVLYVSGPGVEPGSGLGRPAKDPVTGLAASRPGLRSPVIFQARREHDATLLATRLAAG
jgi:hypothetical protein